MEAYESDRQRMLRSHRSVCRCLSLCLITGFLKPRQAAVEEALLYLAGDPFAFQLLGRNPGGVEACEGIEHQIALVG